MDTTKEEEEEEEEEGGGEEEEEEERGGENKPWYSQAAQLESCASSVPFGGKGS